MKYKSPYLIGVKEIYNSNKKINNPDSLLKSTKEFSPLSGSEKKYNPKKWNNKDNIRRYHNCYSYALNQISSSRVGKAQPGYFANYPSLKNSDYNCKTFYKRLVKDNPTLYLVDFDTPCNKGFYKGFIALDTKKHDTDYHFYRQDSNGYWSHKPGATNVINTDSSGKLITNPLKSNRRGYNYNYETPCFFFCINDKMVRSVSSKSKKRLFGSFSYL